MNREILARVRQRGGMVLLVLLGFALGLSLSAPRTGLPLGGLVHRVRFRLTGVRARAAPGATLATPAEIYAAQIPLLVAGWPFEVYLPMVSTPDDRYIMPMQTELPWGAVGFIDNGCTGVLIDSEHVLAAAHCFVYDWDTNPGDRFQQGDWQTGLVYFPNYHPGRPNPPRVAIDRMVVGTRVQTGGEYVASDWGIGHLASPVTNFPAMAMAAAPSGNYPFDVQFAGYARDRQWFPTAPYPQPSPGGYCQYFGPNCWWTPALVDPQCRALDDNDNAVHLDPASCKVLGGNSGSPVIWDAGTPASPAYRITGVIHGVGWAPGTRRFLVAPRYAGGVALATCDGGSGCSQVFVSDGDANRVASRYRLNPGTSDDFSTYRSLGSVSSPGRMAAFALTNGRPQVVVISGNGNLYTRYVGAGGTWQSWSTLSKPSGVTNFLDVDAAYDINGVNQLYVVGNNGLAYTRRRVSSAPYAGWDSWEALTASSDGSFVRISANRDHTGVQQVYLVDVNGNVSTMREILPPGSGWSSLSGFGAIGLPDIADLDAGATEAGRQQVFAVDVNGVLWTREDVASLQAQGPNEPGAWSAWAEWDMELYAPLADPPPVVDDIVSLTADRWQEGTIPRPPVVLATDSQGNVYYTEYTSGDWQPWRSFYH